MTDTEKPLFIPLRAEYYDAFQDGTKTVEYRRTRTKNGYRAPWSARNCRVGRPVLMSRGYGNSHRAQGRVTGFEVLPFTKLPDDAQTALTACYGPLDEDIACITIELDQTNE